MDWVFIALIVALVLFVLAAVGVASGRFNLIAGGLAFFVLAVILAGGTL